MTRNFILAFSLLFIFVPCRAETIIVDQNGFADFNNIQDAINYSWHGDVVIVRPGTYNENVYFNYRAITLTSNDANDVNVVEATILSASSDYSVTFDFGEGNGSILQGFTITGRGIFCYDSSPTIAKNIVRNCANYGIRGQYDTEPVISDNTIMNNGSSGIYGCNGLITNNTISGNQGGGIYDCDGPISYNVISNNSSNNGAGLNGCDGNISNNKITSNKANSSSHVYGGGLFNCSGTISNNTISGNSATTINDAYGGGLYNCDGTISGNTILGNSAIGGFNAYGGGLEDCDGTISNNTISGNKVAASANYADGGGLRACDDMIYNNTIVGNRADDYGGALRICSAYVINNIIAFNEAGSGGGIDGSCNNSYNNLWMNEGGNWGSGATAGPGDICVDPLFAIDGYWDPNGTPDKSDDFWVDGDYHLKSGAGRWDPNSESWVLDDVNSLCIDAGDPCDSIGYEPNPNGSRINMGAYGGTSQASKSTGGIGPKPPPICVERPTADLSGDCKVDFKDFAIMSTQWLDCGFDDPNACWD